MEMTGHIGFDPARSFIEKHNIAVHMLVLRNKRTSIIHQNKHRILYLRVGKACSGSLQVVHFNPQLQQAAPTHHLQLTG